MSSLAVTPHGRLRLAPSAEESLAPALIERLATALAADDPGGALVELALATDPLPPSWSWARAIGALAVDAARASPNDFDAKADPAIDAEAVAALADAPPPITGAEYVTRAAVEALVREAARALRRAVGRDKLEAFLHRRAPHLSVVGRVCFHLAENKRDPQHPFAFLATYATRIGDDARAQHRPLGEALREYAAARDRPVLEALLGPVQRAAESSALVRRLLDERTVFHPLAWTAREAHAFLTELPKLEAAGVVVRVPDWWRARQRPRPRLSVVIGKKPATGFGVDALLDVSAVLCVDGEPLSDEEAARILASTDKLVLLRGRWVEVDRDKLQGVLDHWKKAERAAREGGVSFAEAIRLLAGASDAGDAGALDDVADDAQAGWSSLVAGPWLDDVLARLADPSRVDAIAPGRGVRATLRRYQEDGVRWLWLLSSLGLGALLADDMGLGKTLQVIALLAQLQADTRPRDRAGCGPHLLVVPASLVGNWSRELARFAPQLRVAALGRGAREADTAGADVLIVTYGMLLRLGWLTDVRFRTVVLDEAQAIKNAGAKQSRTVKKLRADARIALTGTPVENRLGDLWSIFDFLNPGLLGSAKRFAAWTKRLGEGTGWASLRALVRPYVLRRLKTDRAIVSDLPDKTELRVDCGLSKVQAALYRDSVDALAQALEEQRSGMERRGMILAYLLRLKQICNHPSQWLGDGRFDPSHSGKYQRLREICEELAERQEKVLVFTQFKSMTGPLASFLESIFGRPGVVLHGETRPKDRMKLVDEFQREDGAPFFVLSLKAGGTGLNLTAASHVVHFDRWWNPAVEDQATDRAFRLGQTKNVLVHKLVCRGTIEERIDALLTEKRQTAGAILAKGDEIDLGGLSRDELLRLVSLDIDAALDEAAE